MRPVFLSYEKPKVFFFLARPNRLKLPVGGRCLYFFYPNYHTPREKKKGYICGDVRFGEGMVEASAARPTFTTAGR